jgi:enoyl-CoA hydratase/carnithine racemase
MIRIERDGFIVTLTIDHPEAMNALTPELLFQLQDALDDFQKDGDLRCAILTGAGDRAFCAGADLGRLASRAGWSGRRLRLFDSLDIDKPLVGAINGHCLAGGLALALLCDVRVAAEGATFGCMGTARGIVPGAGQTKRLPQVVGFGNALWLLLSAERISAREALRIGLVNRVVGQGEVLGAASEWARVLASRAPLAVRATKRAVLEGMDLSTSEALKREGELGRSLMTSEDAAEGVSAFAEKRPPVFRGR